MSELADLMRNFGPMVAIVVVFVWQSVVREQRMSRRLDAQTDAMEKILAETINRNTTALERFTAAISLCPGRTIRDDASL